MDGIERVAYACLELFPQLNGLDIAADIDGIEHVIVANLEAGIFHKDALNTWLRANTTPFQAD